MLGLFKDYRKALLTVSCLIALYKCIELMIPLLAARVINALEAHRPTSEIWVMAVTAFVVWVVHGNVLAYVFDRIEMQCFSFPARYHLSVYALDHLLGVLPAVVRRDPALQQVIIERGEHVIADFVVSIIRVVIPLALPFLFVAVMLLWSIPLLGAMVLIGAATDGLITWRLNKTLSPLFQELQGLQNRQGQMHFTIFANLAHLLGNLQAKREATVRYRARYEEFTTARTDAWMRFLGFNLRRGIVINVTHLLTWLIGIWYVNAQGIYSGGVPPRLHTLGVPGIRLSQRLPRGAQAMDGNEPCDQSPLSGN
jgi:ABC-type multidrug transport system fused ATPase/permease subunit